MYIYLRVLCVYMCLCVRMCVYGTYIHMNAHVNMCMCWCVYVYVFKHKTELFQSTTLSKIDPKIISYRGSCALGANFDSAAMNCYVKFQGGAFLPTRFYD